jgi:hypothetical protein
MAKGCEKSVVDPLMMAKSVERGRRDGKIQDPDRDAGNAARLKAEPFVLEGRLGHGGTQEGGLPRGVYSSCTP